MPDNAKYMAELLNRHNTDPLVAGLREIQELHKPCMTFAGKEVCDVCNTETGKPVSYPCPTRRLADDALGGDNNG